MALQWVGTRMHIVFYNKIIIFALNGIFKYIQTGFVI